jgi:hypothetical protein
MGYRWLYLPLFGAFALSMSLTSPALAQEWSYGGSSDSRLGRVAYDNGYRLGAREGEITAREGRAFDFKRDEAYEDADWGFPRGGDRDLYRVEFRRGYEAGYDTAYRRAARSGEYESRPLPPPPPATGYVAYSHGRIAYENGYRDGIQEGSNDFRHQRAYEPFQRDRFRDADHGYDRSYGDKDAYRVDYRAGFRAGYEAGYPR